MRTLLRRTDSRRKFMMFLGDLALISVALLVTVAIYSLLANSDFFRVLQRPLRVYALYVAAFVYLVTFYVFEMYELRERYERLHIFTSVSSVSLVSFLIMFASAKLLRLNQSTVIYLFVFFILATFFLYFWRRLFIWMFLSSLYFNKNVIFIGKDSLTDEISKILKNSDYKIMGVLDSYQQSIFGADENLEERLKKQNITTLIISMGGRLPLEIMKKVYSCKFHGIEVYNSAYFYELLTRKFPIKYYLERKEIPYVNLDPFVNLFFKNTKRIIDFLGALFLLIVFSPFFLVVYLIILMVSGRPVFYSQERLGFQEIPFKLIKFRTMIKNAEGSAGPQWSQKGDVRVTGIGKVLRKTRLDELPQLINILKGDISFVGPRPIRKHFADIVEQQAPFYSLRFMIKPGLTGWAQVHYDYGGTVEGHIDKFQYDLYYIKHASLFLDLFIILKTLQTVIRRPAY